MYSFKQGSFNEQTAPCTGKWWAPRPERPVLCIHGWQDNANTFDALIPRLSPDYSYLAIDLPGHGISSHPPKGVFFKSYEIITTLRRVQNYFQWSKVSLIGHSYGAACSFLFSSYFPKDVDFFVAIDTIKLLSRDAKKISKTGADKIEKLLLYDSFTPGNSPGYSEEILLNRWIKGSKDSLTESSCRILMQRGSEKVNGLFKLNRDSRVKESLSSSFNQKENVKLAKSIACNVLYIKAKESPYFESKANVMEVLNVIKSNAKHFEHIELPGTHHIHLNTPELVAPVINSFVKTVCGQQ